MKHLLITSILLFVNAVSAQSQSQLLQDIHKIANLTVNAKSIEDFGPLKAHEILKQKMDTYGAIAVCDAIVTTGTHAAVFFEAEIFEHRTVFSKKCQKQVFNLANRWNEKQFHKNRTNTSRGQLYNVNQSSWGPSRNIFVDPFSVAHVSGEFESKNSNYIMNQLRQGEVVLTFDDGPYDNPFSERGSKFYRQPTTKMVLAQLHQENTQAMFFVMGRSLQEGSKGRSWREKMFPAPLLLGDGTYQIGLQPEDGSQTYLVSSQGVSYLQAPESLMGQPLYTFEKPYRGHTMATHSQNHKNIAKLEPQIADREIVRGRETLNRELGIDSPFFRFPFGAHNRQALGVIERESMVSFHWEIDSGDTKWNDRDRIMNHILKKLRKQGKGVILFHDTRRVTATHIGWIIRNLKKEGYRPANIKLPVSI